ncbi:hypothetical protein ATO6_13265 [Oceanicola sp. 22II-s10i]|uniref:SDR family NAD(P)-dependent oxidoreductase n=1 Tax=Oceanicola sp. 22II-s10i TaxID=1317116 RepID=UPI000B527E6D|nr:SDR family oxidoreductase [Oceanicola sp. 22II-s10i]OWU84622.1 hypothetical protein ATO6_13265 [Oceanicola sp. 22II-s10i]
MGRLDGKVALITGAGGGIGREMAQLFATEGAMVLCVDIASDRNEETAALIEKAGGRAEALTTDISSRSACHQMMEGVHQRHGKLDVLVNNAMWISYDAIPDVTEEVVDKMFGIGLKAVMWTTQAALPLMEKAGGGSIINYASIAALRGTAERIVYCAVKAGVTGITRASAAELGDRNIRVNAIAPGAVLFPATAERLGPEKIELRKRTTPLGRLGEAEDMARATLFFASDDSAFITGQVLTVDGGRIMSA